MKKLSKGLCKHCMGNQCRQGSQEPHSELRASEGHAVAAWEWWRGVGANTEADNISGVASGFRGARLCTPTIMTDATAIK